MALDNTADQYGPAKAVAFNQKVNEARGLRLLEQGKVDVAFVPTNRERELRFQSVKFPVLGGLLGYRILLIHQESQDKFSRVENIDQLRDNMIAGFGLHWADMQILYSNQIPVIGHPEYEELFNMVEQRRVDYFPRGLNEAWQEIERFKGQHPGLAVEQHLALYYPFPRYFYVNSSDDALAKRLLAGLKIAKTNGSFEKHFFEAFGEWIHLAQLKDRKVIHLNNPFLSDDTPLPDSSFWIDRE
ncbi:hypothetical protein EZV61_14270 [Corallincola luteus]|uniref:Solute-binding protein family 3/N-terminal domain-containing protein n=1 Tax=Corallincola luteus TaxID=1775177 RepID=A0ABY2ALW6_9GAMM|nr:hypothetical protein [Corallincola luteus]TCI02515.1 hypothetical protein EZV61_14270 [Corallincola luteus]